jgi:WD40 repeat protein
MILAPCSYSKHSCSPTPAPHLPCPACTQAESDVFASTGGDRSIALYDLRSARPIRKLVMQTRSNAVAWNPMEAFNFTAASEDCNLYTYDMRKLESATCVHKVGTAVWGVELNRTTPCHLSGKAVYLEQEAWVTRRG